MFVLFENFVPKDGAMLLECLVKVSICLNLVQLFPLLALKRGGIPQPTMPPRSV